MSSRHYIAASVQDKPSSVVPEGPPMCMTTCGRSNYMPLKVNYFLMSQMFRIVYIRKYMIHERFKTQTEF